MKNPKEIQLLEAAYSELQRLRMLLLPHYEGKLGEPDPSLVKKIEKFLYPKISPLVRDLAKMAKLPLSHPLVQAAARGGW